MHHDDIDRLRLSPTTQMSPEFMEGAFSERKKPSQGESQCNCNSFNHSNKILYEHLFFFCNWSSSSIVDHGSYRIDEIEKHSVRIDYRLRARTSTGPGKQFDNCSSSYQCPCVQSSSLRSDVLVSNEGTLDGGILNRITPLPRDWFEKYLHQALGNYSLSVCADDSISKLSPRPPPLSPSTPCTQPSGTT